MLSNIIWQNGQAIATLLEDVPQEIVFDSWGVASSTLYYSANYDLAPGLVSGLLVHPQFPWLIMKKAVIRREEANLAKISVAYEGIPPATDDRKYSMKGVTETSPIESHKNFIKFAGTPTSPAPGAVFDQDGRFKGFIATTSGSTPNPKAGIKSYLSPSISYQEVRTCGSGVNIEGMAANLGKIDTPPTSNVYVTVTGRNWLLAAIDGEQIGLGVKVTRNWRLSGPRGWDQDIYGS